MENGGGELEVDQQGEHVHDGGDERAGHHGGVQPGLLGQHGQRAAHELGDDDGAEHRQAHGERHHGLPVVQKAQLQVVRAGQGRAALWWT